MGVKKEDSVTNVENMVLDLRVVNPFCLLLTLPLGHLFAVDMGLPNESLDTIFGENKWGILLEKMSHRSRDFREILNESPVKTGVTEETSNTLDGRRMRTASIAKSLASHISSKGISQSRAIKIGATGSSNRNEGLGHVGLGYRVTWGVGGVFWYCSGEGTCTVEDQEVIDSGCSKHMTGNMYYLIDYEEIDGGYVVFGGNPKGGKITGKDLHDKRVIDSGCSWHMKGKMSYLTDYEEINESTFDFSSDDKDDDAMAYMNNLDTTIQVSPIPTTRIRKDHPLDQVIEDLQLAT
nr:hypothetical protein [Tanacetum cinerariifolium]